jgi:hypothetical protein
MTQTDLRVPALRILGITTETQLARIREVITDLSSSPSTLLEWLPVQIIALAGPFAKPDYVENVSKQLQVDPRIVEAAKTIFAEEIGAVADHPAFPLLKSLVQKFLQKNSSGMRNFDQSSSERTPYLSIQGFGHSPLLLGTKPPFLPLLRVELLNAENRVLWAEQITWFDAIFVANSLINAVAEHAEGIQDMIAQNMIAKAEPGSLDEAFGELETSIRSLRNLLSQEGTTSASPVSDSTKIEGS